MTAINVSALGSSLTGSSFDWQSFVDEMMELNRAPITRLETEQSLNTDKISALSQLKTNFASLQTATQALNASGLFTSRTATSSTSGSNWTLTASSGATTGAYAFNVSQLATSSRRTGTADIGSAINATNDVSSVTIASMATATSIKAGSFTINGAQVSVALTDSLQDVFNKISTATGGAVTASYNAGTDKISLNSTSEIVLGAPNDSSNFLSAAQLSNNGTTSVSSAGALGAVNTTAMLTSARLRNGITAVDGSGNGSFSINGVSISYNVNTDSISSIISRINSSKAGVTASYDKTSDRMVLVNTATGDMGFGLSEAAGGFLDAVGLSMTSAGATTERGKNALFTINGGSVLSSASNTLTSDVTGITGLTVAAASTGAQTINVAADTTKMKDAIQSFVDAYNLVQSSIELQTKTTVKDGTLTTSTLTGVREVDQWASGLRSKVFASMSGLTGTVKRLADLGLDFNGTSQMLSIRDTTKLQKALENNIDDVTAFFNTSTTGFAATVDSYLGKLTGNGSSKSSAITSMSDRLLKANSGIDKQIDQIERQLEQERKRMEAAFQAMQVAQTNAKSILSTLEKSFNTNSDD